MEVHHFLPQPDPPAGKHLVPELSNANLSIIHKQITKTTMFFKTFAVILEPSPALTEQNILIPAAILP